MSARTRSRHEQGGDQSHDPVAEIFVCKSCPDRSVFIESGNTDGWISSTVTVDIDRWK